MHENEEVDRIPLERTVVTFGIILALMGLFLILLDVGWLGAYLLFVALTCAALVRPIARAPYFYE